MVKIKGPNGYVLGITLIDAYRSKPDDDEGSGIVLSGGSVEVNWVGNLEELGPVYGEPLGNLEVNIVGNKLGIYGGEVLSITLGVVDRSKLGGDEG